VLAEPKPSLDAPRRVVVSLSAADPARANAAFSTISGIRSFSGQDLARMPVVACGPGLRHLIASQTEPVERIEVVRNGLPEIVERMLAGWVHLRP